MVLQERGIPIAMDVGDRPVRIPWRNPLQMR